MSTAQAPSGLFEEIAAFFASAPSAEAIANSCPCQASVEQASELLVPNGKDLLDTAAQEELKQYEQAELLMRLVKARIRSSRGPAGDGR